MKLDMPKFWDYAPNKFNFLIYLFFPATLIVEMINFFKNKTNKEYFNIKTICIGNIYLGGTGKTPLSIFLGNELIKRKKEPVMSNFHRDLEDKHTVALYYLKMKVYFTYSSFLKNFL